MNTKLVLLMGVSGSGKTTIGTQLAAELGWPYADADTFHPPANIAKMSAGRPLNDEDRAPWLQSIRSWIDERLGKAEHGVVSCSALKRKYRDVLRRPDVTFVYLRGTRAQIEQRLSARSGHFFDPRLLDSQFEALEEPTQDEAAITVSIAGAPAEIVAAILAALGAQP
jgi:carbohydrate kinase (thermoresistant glucokinase family)